MPQFRLETALGSVFVALWRNCSSDVKNGALWRRSGEGGGPATKLAGLSTGWRVSLVCRGELQSVSAVLIVGWIGGHQVFFRPFRETKAGLGQVVHFKERMLMQLEEYRLCKVVIDQCGVPDAGRGFQQQCPEVKLAGVEPSQWVWCCGNHQVVVGVAHGVNHGADVVVAARILPSEYLYAVVIDEGVGVLDGCHVVAREQFASMR